MATTGRIVSHWIEELNPGIESEHWIGHWTSRIEQVAYRRNNADGFEAIHLK